jgi:hypothetical protein
LEPIFLFFCPLLRLAGLFKGNEERNQHRGSLLFSPTANWASYLALQLCHPMEKKKMNPTLELDGLEVAAVAFAKVPAKWVLGRIYNGDALSRARVYVDILNRLPSDRASRSKVQHYEGEIHFQL